MVTRLAAMEIAVLEPYKFMAVIRNRVIHPDGRACGVATTAAKRYGAMVTAVGTSPVMLER